jgi:molybdenum cofactor cytidylyltransferase
MKILGVILAAGRGVRVGGPKALLLWRGRTFLEHVADIHRQAGLEAVVTVVGAEAERVRVMADAAGIGCALNARYEDGMLSSLLCGLARAEADGADAIVVHPVDHPRVAVATVRRVADALRKSAVIAVPSLEDRRGHPTGFARAAWPALRSMAAERGARGVLHDHPDWVVHVPGDPGCRDGVNTPEDYERLTAR